MGNLALERSLGRPWHGIARGAAARIDGDEFPNAIQPFERADVGEEGQGSNSALDRSWSPEHILPPLHDQIAVNITDRAQAKHRGETVCVSGPWTGPGVAGTISWPVLD